MKSDEVIPCDGTLVTAESVINYSFVTGEERPRKIVIGQEVYAGGKVVGTSAEILVSKGVDQSYLTQLWNESIETGSPVDLIRLIDHIGSWFVYAILFLAVTSLIYWYPDMDMMINAATSILIIACPCVIALSVPFIYGNMLRLFNKIGFYVRHTDVIFRLDEVDTVIFDKTGTITDLNMMHISYKGQPLSNEHKGLVRTLCAESSHPLSKALYRFLDESPLFLVSEYEDQIGLGLSGTINGHAVRIGSAGYIFDSESNDDIHTQVIVEIDGNYLGRFIYQQEIREGIADLINLLSETHEVLMMSGDNDADQSRMAELFPERAQLYFNQKPIDKLRRVQSLQQDGRSVMMLGDGLNDAGALKASDVGAVISDQSNQLSPACDVIIDSSQVNQFSAYLSYCNRARYLLYGAFAFALLYNLIGLSFAFTGELTPLVAAILMPISSGTILIYALVSTRVMFGQHLS